MAPSSDRERLALDITTLKQQYAKLRERQRQAHIILSGNGRGIEKALVQLRTMNLKKKYINFSCAKGKRKGLNYETIRRTPRNKLFPELRNTHFSARLLVNS